MIALTKTDYIIRGEFEHFLLILLVDFLSNYPRGFRSDTLSTVVWYHFKTAPAWIFKVCQLITGSTVPSISIYKGTPSF
jgi:hypothetical protein